MDWSTLGQRRVNPKMYDAFTTGIGNFADPTHLVVLSCNWPGWNCDEEVQKIKADMIKETDPKKRYALWEQQTRLFYQKVPVIRYGDLHGLRAARKSVKGFNDKTERPRFYNVWLDK
jgi:peptide/nickel transport system substrate-binding protein